jgi:formylmethanofuran dehydrogenase subunit C
MRKVAEPDGCSYDNCPGVWADGDTVVVRGDMVDRATLERAAGEAVVRLPRAMVLQAAERLRQG